MALSTLTLTRPLAAIGLAASLALAGCGTATETPLGTVLGGVTSTLGFGADQPTAEQDPRAALDRATIDAIGQPLLLVELVDQPGASLMTRVGQNRGVDSWRSRSGLGLAVTQAGLLRSTRGLGFDLMASDPGGTAHALATRQSAEVTRVMVYLDGALNEAPERHLCHVSNEGSDPIEVFSRAHATTRMSERCTTPGGGRYVNRYWVEASGVVRRSEQWVSEAVGAIRVERLTD